MYLKAQLHHLDTTSTPRQRLRLGGAEAAPPVHTYPVGPKTSSAIDFARFGHSQDLSLASRGAAEAPTPVSYTHLTLPTTAIV